MKSSGLASAFGGNLAIMDIYAAQKMFGRGRTFDRIDIAREAGAHDRRVPGASCAALLGPGFQIEPPSGRGQQFEAMLAGLFDDGGHLEPVRAVHRDVHHLQLLRDRRHAAAVGDRHPARARRHAAADPEAVPRRERRHRPHRVDRRRAVRAASSHAASPRRSASLISDVYGVAQHARRDSRHEPLLLAACRWHRRRDEHGRRARSRRRNAARVDPVQALQKGKYQVLSAGESRLRARARLPSSASVSVVLPGRRRRRASFSTPATSSRSSSRCCSARCSRWRSRARSGRCSSGSGRSRERWPPTA